MDLDIKRAFLSPFSDKKWYVKLIFPSIILLFWVTFLNSKSYIYKILTYNPSIFIFLIFALVLSIIFAGFIVQFRHNAVYNLKPIIPDLKGNISEYFVQGFISGIINSAYIILNKGLDLIGHIPVKGIKALILGIFLLLAYILFLILGAFSQNIYADSFYFHKAFDYKRIFSLMSKVKKEIFIYFIFFFVSSVCFILILVPFAIISRHIHMKTTYFLILLYPIISIIGVILCLILYHLQAQVYNIAKFRLENVEWSSEK